MLMATYTTNLNLKKPAYSDTRDIGDINNNMDLIDTAVNGRKTKQTAKTDPTASGTAVDFIDSITQNANGEITATKKTVRTISRSTSGLCPAPPSGSGTTKFLREDGSWSVPPDTTYGNATTSAAGLMSSSDKTKLNGIAAGAQPGTVTGVKVNGTTKTPTSGTVDIGTVLTPSNVTNKNASMGWNTLTTLATIGGVDIKAKIPANPNTNTWRGFQVKQWSAMYSLSHGNVTSISANSFAAITPTGYTPVAVLKIATGNQNVDVARFDGGATGDDEMLRLRWNGPGTGGVATGAYITILYLQNG